MDDSLNPIALSGGSPFWPNYVSNEEEGNFAVSFPYCSVGRVSRDVFASVIISWPPGAEGSLIALRNDRFRGLRDETQQQTVETDRELLHFNTTIPIALILFEIWRNLRLEASEEIARSLTSR